MHRRALNGGQSGPNPPSLPPKTHATQSETAEDSPPPSPPPSLPPSLLPSLPPSPSSVKVYDDGTNTFFWQAHTVLAGLVLVCGLVYITFFDSYEGDTAQNMRRGLVAVIVVFILIGVIHMPDGPFLRPHPVLWRLALCVNILYVLMLIFILFQSVDDTRQFLTVFDSELGRPLPERDYADDCRIYTPDNENGSFVNVIDKLDVFVPCHFFGWWVKALIVRDVFLLNIISVGFEILEYTLECQLPNFGECWWDHWILDFVVCNGLGIWLGMKTCEYLEMKSYHWRGLFKTSTIRGKLRRAVTQFTPYSWTTYRWGYTESFSRFIFVITIIIFWQIQELNTFYLKTILWVPPNHILNFYREVLYAVCGSCAMKEMYDYLSSSDKNARIGRFSWLIFVAIICEVMIDIKFGWAILTIPLPQHMVLFWSVLLCLFLLWAFWKFTLPFRDMPVVGGPYRHLVRSVLGDRAKTQ